MGYYCCSKLFLFILNTYINNYRLTTSSDSGAPFNSKSLRLFITTGLLLSIYPLLPRFIASVEIEGNSSSILILSEFLIFSAIASSFLASELAFL
mgnify:CR=1 FL=1